MIAIAGAPTQTLADLSAALDAGEDPVAVRDRALDVARRAWRLAERAQVAEQSGAQADEVVTIRCGQWFISTEGAHSWTVCPRCETVLHLPDPGLIGDRIREHLHLACAGDAVTTAAGYIAELYETYTPAEER